MYFIPVLATLDHCLVYEHYSFVFEPSNALACHHQEQLLMTMVHRVGFERGLVD